MGSKNPWADWAQILFGGRRPWRNHAIKIWWRSVQGFLVGWGSKFALSHILWRSSLQHSHYRVSVIRVCAINTPKLLKLANVIYTKENLFASKKAPPLKSATRFGQTVRTCLRPCPQNSVTSRDATVSILFSFVWFVHLLTIWILFYFYLLDVPPVSNAQRIGEFSLATDQIEYRLPFIDYRINPLISQDALCRTTN